MKTAGYVRRYCYSHGCTLLSLVCKDCGAPLCERCIVRDHRGHSVVEAEEVADDYRQRILRLLRNDSVIVDLKQLDTQTDDKIAELTELNENVQSEIDKRAEELIAEIETKRRFAKDKVDNLKSKYSKEYVKTKHTLSRVLQLASFEDSSSILESRHISAVSTASIYADINNLMKTVSISGRQNQKPFSFQPDNEFGNVNEVNESQSSKSFSHLVHSDFDEEFTKETNRLEERGKYLDTYLPSKQETGENFGLDAPHSMDKSYLANLIEKRPFLTFTDKKGHYSNDIDDTVYHDSEGIPTILSSFKGHDGSIDEIIPMSYNKAFMRCQNDLFYIRQNENGVYSKILALIGVTQIFLAKDFNVIIVKKDNLANRVKYSAYSMIENYEAKYFCFLDSFCGRIFHSTSNYLSYGYFRDCTLVLKSFDKNGALTRIKSAANLFRITCVNDFLELESGDLVISYIGSFGDSRVEILDESLQHSLSLYALDIGQIEYTHSRVSYLIRDSNEFIILAVSNAHSLHILDKHGKFCGCLMTEDDGLQGPTCLAFDMSGYLWIGCSNGRVINVHYKTLLSQLRHIQIC